MPLRVGEHGTTAGRLNPAGQVFVRDTRYPARAVFGAIEPGTPVVVVGANDFGVIVRPAVGEIIPVPSGDHDDDVILTPPEKLDERADHALDAVEEAHEELRTYLVVLLVLPVLC